VTDPRPLVYLDVDDTILRRPTPQASLPAPGVTEFLRFLARHFEVRWLTRWCPGGRMRADQLDLLCERLGMPQEELSAIANPRAFLDEVGPEGSPVKWRALDWQAIEAGRPFAWIENALAPEDRAVLAQHGLLDHWIPCDVTARPDRLREVREILEQRFGLA
jgi:hypothetical protein